MLALNGSGAATVRTVGPRSSVGKPGQPLALHTETPPQIQPARLRLLAARLHSLGERPLFEFLAEIIAAADPVARLEAYARLAPLAEFIAANDGDRMTPARLVSGGRP
jgi:hypothetical protein